MRAAEIQLPVPRGFVVIVQMQRDEKLRPLGRQVPCQGCVVEIEQTGAESLCLAVNDIEDLRLLPLRESDVAHEG
jgi:hypothetical protein